MVIHSHKRLIVLTILALFALLLGYSSTFAQTPSTTSSDVELVGVIQSAGTNTITVNQQVINTANAEINVALTVGTAVKVEGSLSADGQIIARQVQAPDAAQNDLLPDEVEITGLLSASTDTTMTIGGQTFDVSAAEIKAGVAVGQIVKVHATFSNEGIWVAREVALVAQDNNDNPGNNNNQDNNDQNDDNSAVDFNNGEFELTGTLTAMNATTITVAGQTINIANAEIKDTLVVGTLVEAHVSMVDGQLVAREVELASQNDNRGSGNGGNDDQPNGNNGNDNNGGNNPNNNNDDTNHPEDNHNGGDDQNGDNHGGNNSSDDNGHGGDNGGHGGDNGGHGSDDGSGHG